MIPAPIMIVSPIESAIEDKTMYDNRETLS
jgi:hypothetical protein